MARWSSLVAIACTCSFIVAAAADDSLRSVQQRSWEDEDGKSLYGAGKLQEEDEHEQELTPPGAPAKLTQQTRHGTGAIDQHNQQSRPRTPAEYRERPYIPDEYLKLPYQVREVINGSLTALFNGTAITQVEEECLKNYTQIFGENLMEAALDIVLAIEALVYNTDFEIETPSLIDVMLRGRNMLLVMFQISDACVSDNVRSEFQDIVQRFRNFSYAGFHIASSLGDIEVAITTGVRDWRNHSFYEFGLDIGKALNKVIFGTETLPSAAPGKEVVEPIIQGFLDGFFGGGFTIHISLPEHPNGTINMSLQECLEGNFEFWKEMVAVLWLFFSSLSGHDKARAAEKRHDSMIMLAIAMVKLPKVLSRCGIREEQEKMLRDALASLNLLHFSATLPDAKPLYEPIAAVGRAEQDWLAGNYRHCGLDIGIVLQGLLLLCIPGKYNLSAVGSLEALDVASTKSAQIRSDAPPVDRAKLLPGGVALAVVLSAVLAVAMRGMRLWHHHARSTQQRFESCATEEDSEALE